MFSGLHIPSRVKKIGEAACAAVASAALLLAYASPALAQNTANGITETGDPNSAAASQTANSQAANSGSSSNSDSQSDTSAGFASDAANSADANTANNSGDASANSAADAQSQDAAQDDGTNAPSAAAADAALSEQFQNDFVAACPAGAKSRTITITGDIALTKSVMKPKCDIVIVSDGNPHTISWGGQAKGSALWPEAGHTVTIGAKDDAKNNLIFTNNGTGQSLIHSYGTVNIYGGTFQNNTADKGAVVFNDGMLNIYDGTFKNNTATGVGGGVVYQNSGKTTITGGTFTENAQEFDVCTRDAYGNVGNGSCRNDAYKNAGGGAIHTDGGDLIIQGDVTFSKNHANAAAFMTGGGAIYAHGNLWVFNDALDSSKKPTFTGNWTAVGVGDQNTQYLNDDATKKVLPTGGAGGAIFLQGFDKDNPKSIAYFMGGVFEGNTSGYLGGAVYTEENTTAFMGKAVAESNVAGHFGGGLWLCPSGQGAASEGGNIALLNNSVDYNIDSNTENHGEQYMAGDDLAIMNPKGKKRGEKEDGSDAKQATSEFRLLNTWFMDRSEAAVKWYWDGTPQTKANGFADEYQTINWKDTDWGGFPGGPDNVSRYADTTNGHPLRFEENAQEGSAHKQGIQPQWVTDAEQGYGVNLNITNPVGKGIGKAIDDGTQTWNETDDSLTVYTGVALKAQLTDYGKANGTPTADGGKSVVWNNAAVRFTNNAARLSGGAFGTDGVISFSTPYSASWDKVDVNKDAQGKLQYLAGSEWTLRTADGGMLNENLRPLDCQDKYGDEKAEKTTTCWNDIAGTPDWPTGHNTNGDGTWKTVDIVDNGVRDTNPQPGKIGVENLKPGTYYLKEKAAPNGYLLSSNVYKFTIKPHTDGIAEEPDIELDQSSPSDDNGGVVTGTTAITNKPGSVGWSKVDSADSSQVLPGSEWSITKLNADGTVDNNFAKLTITDCVLSETVTACPKSDANSNELKDSNGAEGRFTVDGLLAGDYKLVETKAPDGYQQPDKDTYYTFTIDPTSADAVKLTKHTSANDTTGTEVDGNQIANTPTEVSWKKVDVADDSKLLSGTEWTITKWDTTTNSAVVGDAADSHTVADSRTVTDCTSADCAKQSNTKQSYVDKNPAEGHFTVRELTYSSTPENAKTQYKLVETKAQDGYVKPDPGKTYAIITINAKGQSSMTLYGEWNTSSNVATTQCLAQKPATQSSDSPGAGTAKTAANATATAVARIAVRFGIPAERRTVVPTAGGETADECTLTNVKVVVALPFTGGTDARTWLLIGGIAAVAAAIILALINEYRKRRGLA